MEKKIFYTDYEDESIFNGYNGEFQTEILRDWNHEVPSHVKVFNESKEDRNAVIYFALFLEFHINRSIETLFPDFDNYLGISKTSTSTKINLLASFRLFPRQIFQACRCVNNIRNEFAHEFSIISLDQLKILPENRKKSTVDKLITLTTEYEGDYEYETHTEDSDNLRNRYKSLCLNTITAFRIFQPQLIRLRDERIDRK
ncbi:MAG: hypothetical protein EP332_03990 [Bacteroidetes bacterium]|nr:MAG: hypothetical protein EP332_03990 [Bacteroidota bacterium]